MSIRLGIGQMKEKSKRLKRQATTAATRSKALSKSMMQKRSAIAAFLAQNSVTTWSAKPRTCVRSTLTPLLSATLAQGLTSKGRGCVPYWNDFCAEMSSKLWLPAVTALQDLDSISSNSLQKGMVEKSWFSMELHTHQRRNLQKTSSQFYMCFPAVCTDSENTKFKSRLIRIYPTAAQAAILRQWLGVSRHVFNKTVEHLRQPKTVANWMEIKKWMLKELPEWAKPVPFQIKGVAVRDACEAVKECKRKFMRGSGFNSVRFRSRKSPSQSIFIPKSAIKANGFYLRTLGAMRFSEQFECAEHDARLVFRQGRWFLNVPVKATKREAENQGRIVAIDPGVRTFTTFYSVDSCGKLGRGDFSRILRLGHYLDDLVSRTTKATGKRKRRMRKAADRMRWKIRDLISELHKKTALFFVSNFDIILLPTFEVQGMVCRSIRKIRSKTVRSMLSLAHYRFKHCLKFKAWEHGKTVIDVNEAYTSKTCSWNGAIKQIGGARFIKDAGIVVDRDYNGARGIFLRALADSPSRNCVCIGEHLLDNVS